MLVIKTKMGALGVRGVTRDPAMNRQIPGRNNNKIESYIRHIVWYAKALRDGCVSTSAFRVPSFALD